ncbi:MAG: hypothetical protein HYX79_06050 [Chloroflexi bacterium]|nr:hypothetical protein [Chloroflexota bacterium]
MDLEKTDAIELDLPPEFCEYKDEGCEKYRFCLSCPLPHCIYDRTWGKQRLTKGERDREMSRQFIAKGKKIKELAEAFGVSQRTVQRAIRAK